MTDGRILVGDHDGVYVLKFVGDARQPVRDVDLLSVTCSAATILPRCSWI